MKGKRLFLLMAFLLIGIFMVSVGAKSIIAKPIELKVANFQPPLHKSCMIMEIMVT